MNFIVPRYCLLKNLKIRYQGRTRSSRSDPSQQPAASSRSITHGRAWAHFALVPIMGCSDLTIHLYSDYMTCIL
jgi:hypothetical protein